jgi:hypothetical protein
MLSFKHSCLTSISLIDHEVVMFVYFYCCCLTFCGPFQSVVSRYTIAVHEIKACPIVRFYLISSWALSILIQTDRVVYDYDIPILVVCKIRIDPPQKKKKILLRVFPPWLPSSYTYLYFN